MKKNGAPLESRRYLAHLGTKTDQFRALDGYIMKFMVSFKKWIDLTFSSGTSHSFVQVVLVPSFANSIGGKKTFNRNSWLEIAEFSSVYAEEPSIAS